MCKIDFKTNEHQFYIITRDSIMVPMQLKNFFFNSMHSEISTIILSLWSVNCGRYGSWIDTNYSNQIYHVTVIVNSLAIKYHFVKNILNIWDKN